MSTLKTQTKLFFLQITARFEYYLQLIQHIGEFDVRFQEENKILLRQAESYLKNYSENLTPTKM